MPARSPAERDALLDAFLAFVEAFVHIAAGPLADAISKRLAAMAQGAPARPPAGLTQAATPFLTQREAAKYTGRSVSSLRRARAGGLAHALVGGNVVFEREVLDRWMRGELPVSTVDARSPPASEPGAAEHSARGPPPKTTRTRTTRSGATH